MSHSKFLTNDKNGINRIKIGDAEEKGTYINKTAEKIRLEGVNKSRFVHKGDFLLTNSMNFGHSYIMNIDGCIHDGWLVLSNINNVFNIDFLYYLLSSAFAYKQFSKTASGAVVQNLNSEKVSQSVFPSPPLIEQARIAKRIEELFVRIDIIDQNQADIDTLYEEFRKHTLTLATQGKLVPQDPNDEPASVLLERICAEKKAKLGKKYVDNYIYKGDDNCYYEKVGANEPVRPDDLPFEIPDFWC